MDLVGSLWTCKGKCCIYHITSLVPGGIFRPWASTCTRPEKWYSIQCLHFVWAHRWLTQIAEFTDIDFTLLLINLPAKFSASWDSCKVHFTCNVRILFSISCDRAANLCLCVFLSLAKHTKKRWLIAYYKSLFVCFLQSVNCINEPSKCIKLKGAALCLWLWPWLTPGECSCSSVTVIRCHWGKSNLHSRAATLDHTVNNMSARDGRLSPGIDG